MYSIGVEMLVTQALKDKSNSTVCLSHWPVSETISSTIILATYHRSVACLRALHPLRKSYKLTASLTSYQTHSEHNSRSNSNTGHLLATKNRLSYVRYLMRNNNFKLVDSIIRKPLKRVARRKRGNSRSCASQPYHLSPTFLTIIIIKARNPARPSLEAAAITMRDRGETAASIIIISKNISFRTISSKKG